MFDRVVPLWPILIFVVLTRNFRFVSNGTARFLHFSFIIEGALKKVSQFLMPLEPIYNQNVCFYEQNVYNEHCHKV